MVCLYCGNKTQVINSRPQKAANRVWRRRQCVGCGSIITTEEAARYESALMVRHAKKTLEPFLRDKLLISLHKSLAHRKTAQRDASELVDTVIGQLRGQAQQPVIELTVIIEAAATCLERFDILAGQHYRAYHSGR
jgi:transcriptional repressor NrdR